MYTTYQGWKILVENAHLMTTLQRKKLRSEGTFVLSDHVDYLVLAMIFGFIGYAGFIAGITGTYSMGAGYLLGVVALLSMGYRAMIFYRFVTEWKLRRTRFDPDVIIHFRNEYFFRYIVHSVGHRLWALYENEMLSQSDRGNALSVRLIGGMRSTKQLREEIDALPLKEALMLHNDLKAAAKAVAEDMASIYEEY